MQSGAEPSGAVQRAGGTCIAELSAVSSDAKPPDDANRPTPPAPCTSPSRKHSTHANASIAPDAAVYGPMSWRNSSTSMPEAVNRYRFCGLPTGVNMLPRFADGHERGNQAHAALHARAAQNHQSQRHERNERNIVGHRHAGEERKPDQHAGNSALRPSTCDQPRPHGVQYAKRAESRHHRHQAEQQRQRMPINVGGIPGIGRHKGARRQGRRKSNDQHGLARRKSLNHAHNRPKRYVFHPDHKMQGYHVAFERNGQTSWQARRRRANLQYNADGSSRPGFAPPEIWLQRDRLASPAFAEASSFRKPPPPAPSRTAQTCALFAALSRFRQLFAD